MEGNFLSIHSLFLKTYAEEIKLNAFPKYKPVKIVQSESGPIQIFQYKSSFVHSLPNILNIYNGVVFLKSFKNNKNYPAC